jgi:hypothetical protein
MLTFTEKSKCIHYKTVCVLEETCSSTEELNLRVPENAYYAIVLNGNCLDDLALWTLSGRLTRLSKLHIADTNITGACLERVMSIPKLKELNIAANSLLDLDNTTAILCKHLPNSDLEKLDISGNFFSISSLKTIIEAANIKSQSMRFTLVLGQMKHLDEKCVLTTINHLLLSRKSHLCIEYKSSIYNNDDFMRLETKRTGLKFYR